jgi:hypothetical protein
MQGHCGDADRWLMWRKQVPTWMLGLCPAGVPEEGTVWPLSQLPKCPLGRQELAVRTGSHTGWHIFSHQEADGGHR